MQMVKRNQKLHNPDSPLLIGDVNDSDVVTEVNEPSYIERGQDQFDNIDDFSYGSYIMHGLCP
jgi:hypothetical protein